MASLPHALEAERDSIITQFVTRLSDWAKAHDRNVEKELESAGKYLFSEAGRYRPQLSMYNWFKKTYKGTHRERAQAEIADDAERSGKKGLDLAQLMNSVAVAHWNELKRDPDKYADLQAEYNDSDALYVHDGNMPPRSPTKTKLKTLAQSRRTGRNYIRKALEGAARYAEDNSFDIACYFADRTLSDYGGVLPEQIGTTAGVKFIATIAQKGFSGDFLQILAQSSHSNLDVQSKVGQKIYEPHDPISDAFPSLLPNRRTNGTQDFTLRSRISLNQAIRALIKSHANRVIKDESLLMNDRCNIPGNARKLEADLAKRGVKIQFEPSCSLTYADLADYRATTLKLTEVYAAIALNQITFHSVDITDALAIAPEPFMAVEQ